MRQRTRSKKQPQRLNLMVCGHSRTGKTDFIHTFYETLTVKKLHPKQENAGTFPLFPVVTDTPISSTCLIECLEPGKLTTMRLNLIDSPGMDVPSGIHKLNGAAKEAVEIRAKKYSAGLVAHIAHNYKLTMDEELKVVRNPHPADHQIHACLYFMHPDSVLASQGLNSMDKIVLPELCKMVNIIPCLAKGDTVTKKELKKIQTYLKADFEKMRIFDFEDDEGIISNRGIFSIVNSEEHSCDEDGSRKMGFVHQGNIVLGREYSWGPVLVEDPDHCDFEILKDALLVSRIDELKQATKFVFYENWRTEQLINQNQTVLVPKDLQNRISKLEVEE